MPKGVELWTGLESISISVRLHGDQIQGNLNTMIIFMNRAEV
jgi:hypothetical protein